MSLFFSKELMVPDKVMVYAPNKLAELSADSLTLGETVYADGQINGQVEFLQSPLAPTPALTDNSTLVATTAYVTNSITTALSGSGGSSSNVNIAPLQIFRGNDEIAYISAPTVKNTLATVWIAPIETPTASPYEIIGNTTASVQRVRVSPLGVTPIVYEYTQAVNEIWLPEITSTNSHLFDGYEVRIRSDNSVIPFNNYAYWSLLSVNDVYLRHETDSAATYGYNFKSPLVKYTGHLPFNFSSSKNMLNLSSGSRYSFMAFKDLDDKWAYLYIA